MKRVVDLGKRIELNNYINQLQAQGLVGTTTMNSHQDPSLFVIS
jgi:hypothetical protein